MSGSGFITVLARTAARRHFTFVTFGCARDPICHNYKHCNRLMSKLSSSYTYKEFVLHRCKDLLRISQKQKK